jgi:hypothetical protein
MGRKAAFRQTVGLRCRGVRGLSDSFSNPTVTLDVITLRSVGRSTLTVSFLATFGLFLVLKRGSRDYSMGHSA